MSTVRGTSRVGSPGTRPGDGSHACTVTVLAGAPLPPRCSRHRRGRRHGMLAGALATSQGPRRRGCLREPKRRCRAAPWPWHWKIRPRARARAHAQAQRQVLPSVPAQERALAWALVLVRPHARTCLERGCWLDAGVGAASLLELAVFGWAAGFRRLNLKPPSSSEPETRFFAGGGAGDSDTRLRRVERPPAGGSTKFTLLRRVCGIPLGPTGPQQWQPHAL